jgi:diacylglycerol kinase family enzyme
MFHIILNANSGSSDTDGQRAVIESVFTGAGRPFSLTVVGAGERLEEVAQQVLSAARASGGVVIAAGGDGTISTVAGTVVGSGCAFGVLPQGTFNYFGRTHNIPEDLEAAARALLSARVEPVQVGRLNDRVFLVNASVGLYPTLLEQREHDKRRFGRSRVVAVLSAIRTLLGFRKQLTIQFERDGRPASAKITTLFVANSRLQMEQAGIDTMKVALEQGRLAAIAPKAVGKLALLGLMLRGAIGQLGQADDLISFSFKRMTVRQRSWYGKGKVKVAIDGEVMKLSPPLQFEVIEDQLLLLVPTDTVTS